MATTRTQAPRPHRRNDEDTTGGAWLVILAVLFAIGVALYFTSFAGRDDADETVLRITNIENTAPAAGTPYGMSNDDGTADGSVINATPDAATTRE